MLLQDKNAIVYGAAGGIGHAVAAAFAREGAHVHLAGRTLSRLDAVAAEIRAAGGTAETAEVDALDESAVDAHADTVAARWGSIDVSINLISVGDVQGTPLAVMTLADYEQPIYNAVRTEFLTSRAAARQMTRQRSGVILYFGGEGEPLRDYFIGGFQIALHAVEAFRRQLAVELGPHGVRVLTLQTGGIPESIPAGDDSREMITEMLTGMTLLGRTATLSDVGDVAAFAASDRARSITGTALNISAGAIVS